MQHSLTRCHQRGQRAAISVWWLDGSENPTLAVPSAATTICSAVAAGMLPAEQNAHMRMLATSPRSVRSNAWKHAPLKRLVADNITSPPPCAKSSSSSG